MPGDKLRFRFAKTGILRLLSHHDLMRCMERLLRRAALPFKSTGGFHPGPRIVFPLSLPLGVSALDEVVEIEFLRPLEELETLELLREQAPSGLLFTRVSVIPMKRTGVPRRIVYSLNVPSERMGMVTGRAAELLASPKLWVERLRPSPKRLNIRPYLRSIEVQPPGESAEDGRITLDLWVTSTGTARADELLRLLAVADLIESGTVVERITVELRDEVTTTDPNDNPPDGPADTLPLDPTTVAALTEHAEEQPVPAIGPVVE